MKLANKKLMFEIWLQAQQAGCCSAYYLLTFYLSWHYSLLFDTENWLLCLILCQSRWVTLMKCFALLSRPRVVWRELSAPTGTKSLRFSRQLLKCALRFFSSSLWVDLKINIRFNSLILSRGDVVTRMSN